MKSNIYLSILVPVYNWDINSLLERLDACAEKLHRADEVEIIIIDDASSEQLNISSLADRYPCVRYERLSVNQGRVAVRNLLVSRAKGKYILFLDADMMPDDESFLQKYIDKAKSGCDILCGGISYIQNKGNQKEYSFYYYKSAKTEAVSAEIRNRSPWRYLFTSNIMLRKSIVDEVKFDKRFTGYGFEDIEWAIRLRKSYEINHIENTCSHMGVMTKSQTFRRMRESIENYSLLISLHPFETASGYAYRVTRLLIHIPQAILKAADVMLEKLFFLLPSNILSFAVFQCDKMILLAIARKRKEYDKRQLQ